MTTTTSSAVHHADVPMVEVFREDGDEIAVLRDLVSELERLQGEEGPDIQVLGVFLNTIGHPTIFANAVVDTR